MKKSLEKIKIKVFERKTEKEKINKPESIEKEPVIPSFNKEDVMIPKKRKKKKINWFFKLTGLVFSVVFIGIVLGIISFFYITKDLPRPKDFADTEFNQSTKIYDRNGEILLSSVYGEEKRTYVELSKIPILMQKAVISTEDAKFYKHGGFDMMGIIRAIKVDLETGTKSQGASTITQQLIRATFLTAEKTVTRKIKEILLSIELERKYSKDQILEWYLNKVPFGINIYGIEEASLTYFEKPAQELNLAESAMLAASIQAPSYYSPYGDHVKDLMDRKNYVLKRMFDEGYINEEQKTEAEKYEFKFAKVQKNQAHHFVEYVKSILKEKYGPDALETEGLKIYTTLDWTLQKSVEKIVKDGVAKNRKAYGAYNGAMVVMNPKNGEILALVGSADPWADPAPEGCTSGKNCRFEPWMNIPVQAERQPGSSFKPIIYASAFEKGATDQTIVIDEPTNFGGYSPKNFDLSYRGAITMRNSLAQSLNIPAVKTLRDYGGLNDTVELAKKMGISTLTRDPDFYGLPFALGAADVKMVDMASAFSVFSNGGYSMPHSAIIKIVDAKGETIYKNENTPRKVLNKKTCDMITSILSDNAARTPVFGANSHLRFDDYQVSVKTGTTQNSVDGWTIGYTSDAVVVVWSGNNDRTPIDGTVGEMTAAPMWKQAIEKTIQLYNTKPTREANPWDGMTEEEKMQKTKEILELIRDKRVEKKQLEENSTEQVPNTEMQPTP
ncbi:MAG: transglycosylase domain-containing protein [Candidatus Pacebacteria bacterium]|nr:transglycosylase domain-containing protein [Candidatus Paceibacterota bacterium]